MDLYYFNKYGIPQNKRVRVDHVTWDEWLKSWNGIRERLQHLKDRYRLNRYELVDIKSIHESTKDSPYLVENCKRIERTHSVDKDFKIKSTKTIVTTPLFRKVFLEEGELLSLSQASTSSSSASMSDDDPRRARAIADVPFNTPFNPPYHSTLASNRKVTTSRTITRETHVSSSSTRNSRSGHTEQVHNINTTLQLETEFLEASEHDDILASSVLEPDDIIGSPRGNKRFRSDTESAWPSKKPRYEGRNDTLTKAFEKHAAARLEVEKRKAEAYEKRTAVLEHLAKVLAEKHRSN